MGYGDAKSTPIAVSGMITEITTSFPDGGSPELAVAGYDHGFPLTIGKNSRTWTKARDSDAAHEIASFNNLNATIETTKEKHAQIEQNQESDWEFLKKLADRNHFELYVDERKTLHFAPAERQGDRGRAARLRRRAAELQAGGEPRRPDLAGRGLRLGSEDEEGDRRHARRRRGVGPQRQERGPAPQRVRARSARSGRRCACASRCSRRPKPISARRPR